MEPYGLTVLLSVLIALVHTNPAPGHTHHHVHHRIHVPQKIKTVYHTKVIKVPEHHHHYHEREKVVPVHVEKEKFVPVPVHVEKEKFIPVHVPVPVHKEEHYPHYPPLEDDFEGYGGQDLQHYDGGEHNILKKHAPGHREKAPRRQRKIKN